MVPVKSQVTLDELGFKTFKKFLDVNIPKNERRQNKIIIWYLRIYTHLIKSESFLTKTRCRKAMDHLTLTFNVIQEMEAPGEKPYLKRLVQCLDPLMKSRATIIRKMRRDPTIAYDIKPALLLAQNICILRILKNNTKS